MTLPPVYTPKGVFDDTQAGGRAKRTHAEYQSKSGMDFQRTAMDTQQRSIGEEVVG